MKTERKVLIVIFFLAAVSPLFYFYSSSDEKIISPKEIEDGQSNFIEISPQTTAIELPQTTISTAEIEPGISLIAEPFQYLFYVDVKVAVRSNTWNRVYSILSQGNTPEINRGNVLLNDRKAKSKNDQIFFNSKNVL